MARVLLLLAFAGLVLSAASVKPTRTTTSTPSTSANNARQAIRGISAWGIIALVISVILLSVGTYYFIIFYPLMCAKERKYDVIDSSSV